MRLMINKFFVISGILRIILFRFLLYIIVNIVLFSVTKLRKISVMASKTGLKRVFLWKKFTFLLFLFVD